MEQGAEEYNETPCIRLMVAALAACLVLLSGCELATSSADGALTGYWKSTSGDGFELSGNTLEGFRYVSTTTPIAASVLPEQS